MTATILQVRHLQKAFGGRPVLRDVSFSLQRGVCAGLVGVSGCGKSTTARIIAGLETADSGELVIGGQHYAAASRGTRARWRQVQLIFQQPEASFDPRRTLGWSIGEPLRQQGVCGATLRQQVQALLTRVELPAALEERYPFEVSGGQCQRAAIARALAARPQLLICDEVTSALDVTLQQHIVQLIRELCRTQDLACLFITHDLPLLAQVAERVGVMEAGQLVEQGATEELIAHPRSAAARALLGVDFFRMPR
jgi:ABC-type dipeptide/oligopeptide/nickel transport system ATPase subunit